MLDPCLYRVDRSTAQDPAPCGMNSIRHLGSSFRDAKAAFDAHYPGTDAWNVSSPDHGVHLSKWDGTQYVVIASKFLNSKETV